MGVKRGGPIQRKTPLKARTQLRASSGLRRSGPIGRGTSGQSAKAKAASRTRRAEREAAQRRLTDEFRWAVKTRAGGRCEWPGCGEPGDDVHHRAQRSTHPERRHCVCIGVYLCRPHHRSCDTDRPEAERLGMILRRGAEPPCVCGAVTPPGEHP